MKRQAAGVDEAVGAGRPGDSIANDLRISRRGKRRKE
jgi:hypothetical protein